jgi:dUTP pyrophosphatase
LQFPSGKELNIVKAGDKIGQLVIMPVLIPEITFEKWEERGNGAFGSTGR